MNTEANGETKIQRDGSPFWVVVAVGDRLKSRLVGHRPLLHSGQILMSETRHMMIVHHADSLHVGVTNRGANELESALQ